jgi:hypothetical protein
MSMIQSLLSRVKSRLAGIYSSSRDKHLKRDRLGRAKRYFLYKSEHQLALTESQKKEIAGYWNQYQDISGQYHWFAFYNRYCEDKASLKYYIPDSLMYSDIDLFYTNARRCYELDDKNLYDLFFGDVSRPVTVVRKCNGALMDKDYHAVTLEQAVQLCQQAGRVIYKPSRNSQGGKGIFFYDASAGSLDELKAKMSDRYDFIIQEVVRQHDTLNRIHDKSVNTLRIMTFYFNDEVNILSSVLRMGRDGARVDNASSGGIFCGINNDGTLKAYAYDTKGNRWTQHPQGIVFDGFEIAGYEKSCELVKSLAGRFCTTSKLLSWDIAIGADGEPVIIEVNMTFGQVDFHQMCNGPIFGDMTDEVLAQVFASQR